MSKLKELQVKPGKHFRIADFDPSDTSLAPGDKQKTVAGTGKLAGRLDELQDLLFAEHKHKVLIVLQGMDTSGKDGTIRHVMSNVSPQGVRVTSFRRPTPTELDHDYLWRVHAQTPETGEVVIFNRSHYEDVLVVRVHELVPEKVWRKRYDQINEFEQLLAENGVTILKFFLHISRDEQKKRLQERLDDPSKRWKFQHGDIEERKLWDDYIQAYRDAIEKTSTEWAPWFVVPANRKWYRNWVVGSAIVHTLEKLHMEYPQPDLSKEVID